MLFKTKHCCHCVGSGIFSPLASQTASSDGRHHQQPASISGGTGLFKHLHDAPTSTRHQVEQAAGSKLLPDYFASSARPPMESQFRTRVWSSDSTSSNDSGQLSREGSVRSIEGEGGHFTRGGSGRSNDGDIGNFTRGGSGRSTEGDSGQFSRGGSGRSYEAEQGHLSGRGSDSEMTSSRHSPRGVQGETSSTLKPPSSPLQKRSRPVAPGAAEFSPAVEVLAE